MGMYNNVSVTAILLFQLYCNGWSSWICNSFWLSYYLPSQSMGSVPNGFTIICLLTRQLRQTLPQLVTRLVVVAVRFPLTWTLQLGAPPVPDVVGPSDSRSSRLPKFLG